MQQFITDLLAYSRANGAEDHSQRTDLNMILQKVKTELKQMIEEKNPELKSVTYRN